MIVQGTYGVVFGEVSSQVRGDLHPIFNVGVAMV